MTMTSRSTTSGQTAFSPLVLCDRLLSLAQDADHAGLRETAKRLLRLATSVLNGPSALWTHAPPRERDRTARH